MIDLSRYFPPREKILEGLKKPHAIPPALYRRAKLYFGFHALNQYYHRRLGRRSFNTEGIDIFSTDWDNLIILDGCRYDVFEKHSSELPGELSSRISRGSHTVEWLQANLQENDLSDTVYVTASPVYNWHRHLFDDTTFKHFHAVVDVWQDAWDDEQGTVLPEDTTSYAIGAHKQYPNKRLLVHFNQPHYPFIDSDVSGFINKEYSETDSENNVWAQIKKEMDESTKERVRQAYERNLTLTLPHVRTLLEELSGLSVVSADHGNMLGERARPFPKTYWGHPKKMYVEELVKVPWHVYKNGDRKSIQATPAEEQERTTPDEDVSDRLRDLGYVPGNLSS